MSPSAPALRLVSLRAVLALVLVAPGLSACPAHARTGAPPSEPRPTLPRELASDVIMSAMVDELERSRAELRIDDFEPPYFIAFTIKEIDRIHILGKLGAVYIQSEGRTRQAAVDVRVGDYGLDSSEDPELDWVEEGVYEPTSHLPMDASPGAIRHGLWLLADLRYKQALSSYLKVKGQRVYRAEEVPRRPSFSPAPSVVHADPTRPLTADRDRWTDLLRQVGAVLAEDPAIFDSEVSVSFQVETRWLVNTEGTRLRTVHPMYGFHATAYTRADDGMLIDHSIDFYGPSEDALPDDATILARAERLRGHLKALREAPLLDPYTGPALLEPHATGVFFHEVLGHRLEGHRQEGDDHGQTFAKHLGRVILPTFLSIEDDPTLQAVGDIPLNGHYGYDDEGVAASRVVLVDRGELTGFLNSRRPAEGFERSNGHGRAQGTRRPVSRMGNLLVVAHDPVSPDALRERLLEEVRRQGKPFGLIIRDISGGSTNTSAYGYQAFKGETRMVYKVDAETGKETLVRGVELVGTPLVTISKIIAAGTDVGVFNGYCGAESGMVPVSTVAPSTLFSEIELQRSAKPRSRGPVLGPPPIDSRPLLRRSVP